MCFHTCSILDACDTAIVQEDANGIHAFLIAEDRGAGYLSLAQMLVVIDCSCNMKYTLLAASLACLLMKLVILTKNRMCPGLVHSTRMSNLGRHKGFY